MNCDSLVLCHLHKVRVTVAYKGQVGEQNEVVWVNTTMRLNVYTPFKVRSHYLTCIHWEFSFRIARYSDFSREARNRGFLFKIFLFKCAQVIQIFKNASRSQTEMSVVGVSLEMISLQPNGLG